MRWGVWTATAGSHGLGKKLFETIKEHLVGQGLMLKEGRIPDASITAAPALRKNQSGESNPEMEQTRQGNQWRFGMKLHMGDGQSGLVHRLATTAANQYPCAEPFKEAAPQRGSPCLVQ